LTRCLSNHFHDDADPTPEEYANYANTVVAAETGKLRRPKAVSLFGVRNRGDVATQLSADHLIVPLAETLRQNEKKWDTQRFLGPECTCAALVDLLRAEKAPALLISASHGIGLLNGDSRQLRHQGAILCQDWPGPLRHRGLIPERFYVSADHVPCDARLDGLVAFFFACYGGGTPAMDDFSHLTQGAHAQIAPRPFVASTSGRAPACRPRPADDGRASADRSRGLSRIPDRRRRAMAFQRAGRLGSWATLIAPQSAEGACWMRDPGGPGAGASPAACRAIRHPRGGARPASGR
jgi:hypothetical protein